MRERGTVRRFRWFWLWQDREEERWLGRKSVEEGLHLVSVAPFGIYRFEASAPVVYTYRMDYRRLNGREREVYLRLFSDAGWEHVGELAGWHYFRKASGQGASDELFTDRDSMIQKCRRVLGVCCFLGFLSLMNLTRVMAGSGGRLWRPSVLGPIWGVILALLLFACVKLAIRIRQIQRQV
jgi:hypothetical protein